MKRFITTFWGQWAALTFTSWCAAALRLRHDGLNIVTRTYEAGALRFFAFDNPYRLPLEGGDQFEYSPCFALFYGLFAYLPDTIQAMAWALFNASLFWGGVLLWVRLDRKNWRYLLVPLLLCSMELNISLLYQQINAAIIGATLIGLHLMRAQVSGRSAFWVTLATNWKPLPAILVFPLIPFQRPRYLLALIMSSLVLLLCPIIVVGWSMNWELHLRWIDSVTATLQLKRPAQVDIHTVLTYFGWPVLGKVIQMTILAGGVGLLGFSAFKKKVATPSYIAFGAAVLMLVSPRSESPTFVFLAPAYLLLLEKERDYRSRAPFTVVMAAGFLMTFLYTDLWPKSWWSGLRYEFISKCFGALLLCGLALYQLVKDRNEALSTQK